MSELQRIKRDVNRALDEAAGRVLTFDERREWWITDDRFLYGAGYDALMAQAREYKS